MKKIIVISGGSSGLGKGAAELLTKEHAVVLLSQDVSGLERAAKEIGCESEACNVTNAAQVDAAISAIIGRHGRIDVLLNNAGVFTEGNIEDVPAETLKTVIDVNVTGAMLLARAVVPYMKKQGSGLIINTVSQAGLTAKAGRTAYNTSKWAMTGFTKSLELELAPHHIRVTGIYPGKIDTPLFQNSGLARKMDTSDALTVQDVAETLIFIVSRPEHVAIPELGIKHIEG